MAFFEAAASLIASFGIAFFAGFIARFSYRLWAVFPVAAGIAVAGVIWTVVEMSFLREPAEAMLVQEHAAILGFKSFGWLMQFITAVVFTVIGVAAWDIGAGVLRTGISFKAVVVIAAMCAVVAFFISFPHMNADERDTLAAVLGTLIAIGIFAAALLVGRKKSG